MKLLECRVIRRVLGFFENVLLGCFGCFGDRELKVSEKWRRPGRKEQLEWDNTFGSVFVQGDQQEAQEISIPSHEIEDASKINDHDLMTQANYLKSCGTISEIPAELKQASSEENFTKVELSGYPCVTQHVEEKPIPGEVVSEGDSKSTTCPPVCVPETAAAEKCCDDFCAQPESEQKQTSGGGHSKFSSLPTLNQEATPTPSKESIRAQFCVPRDSPCPTPIVLTDDMQTPATAYTDRRRALKTRRRSKVQTEFAYAVLKPIDNIIHQSQTELRNQLEIVLQASNLPPATCTNLVEVENQNDAGCSSPAPQLALIQHAGSKNKLNLEMNTPTIYPSSLSCWLKKCKSSDHGQEEQAMCIIEKSPHLGEIYDVDVSTITLKKESLDSEIIDPSSPVWWAKNGIPNSTTKYKENQRVHWHATPFEERLEKVLTGDKLRPKRKLTIKLDECCNEEDPQLPLAQ